MLEKSERSSTAGICQFNCSAQETSGPAGSWACPYVRQGKSLQNSMPLTAVDSQPGELCLQWSSVDFAE